MQECWYGGSFSFRVICGSLVVRIDAASRPITIHRTTITPLGYIPASYPPLSFAFSLSLSPSSAYARVPSYALLSLSLPTFFITTCLITNSQAYLSRFAWEKLLRIWIIARYCSLLLARLELLFVISPVEIQIIPGGANCYLSAVRIRIHLIPLRPVVLSRNFKHRLESRDSRPRSLFLLFYFFFPIFAWLCWNFYTQSSVRHSLICFYVFVPVHFAGFRKKNIVGNDLGFYVPI